MVLRYPSLCIQLSVLNLIFIPITRNKSIICIVLVCTFEELRGPVRDKGGVVGHRMGVNMGECKILCKENDACKSFVYEKINKGCYMKDKELDGTEPLEKVTAKRFSVRKICEIGNRHLNWIYLNSMPH